MTKQKTKFKDPIAPDERLALTLRILAKGDTFGDIANRYRTGKTTARNIFHETVRLIWDHLQPRYMPKLSAEKCREVSEGFMSRWDFPNCLGAVDGKHIKIVPPANSGSLYFNYKGFHSIVLMAVVDAQHNFLMVNVGQYGGLNDASVFEGCAFGQQVLYGNPEPLPAPPPRPISHCGPPVPHVFVADEAFPLRQNMMRPFPQGGSTHRERLFNYRLSRWGSNSESTFCWSYTLSEFCFGQNLVPRMHSCLLYHDANSTLLGTVIPRITRSPDCECFR